MSGLVIAGDFTASFGNAVNAHQGSQQAANQQAASVNNLDRNAAIVSAAVTIASISNTIDAAQ
jgi:hypothetical protein